MSARIGSSKSNIGEKVYTVKIMPVQTLDEKLVARAEGVPACVEWIRIFKIPM
jgi:hypothetical protein